MSREEIQKLLGGYATDTLGEAERRALFEAALEDQELFDALAKEQALRDVLQDPSARQQLIEALGPEREPFAARAWHWLRQPAALAMAGSMAALLIVGGLVLHQTKHARQEVMMADALAPQPAPSRAAPLSTVAPSARQRKLFRPPAAPPPLPPRALAVGGLAGAAEVRRQTLQTTQTPALSFTARSGAPMASMGRAKAAPSVAGRLAVEYTLLLKDAGGVYSPVPSGAVFHAGDSVRIQVEPSENGYIYLFQRGDATAGWNLVTSQGVEKAQRYVLPPTGGLQSDIPARLELLLVLSRVEQPGFAAPQTADIDALASQAQASSKIMIEYR